MNDEYLLTPLEPRKVRLRGDAVEEKAIDDLLQRLLKTPRVFGFFQSMLLLTRNLPGLREPGEGDDQTRESVFIRSWPSMVRSATDIRSLVALEDDEAKPPHEMEVSFMGLYGLSSPTPAYFWDYIQSHPDSAMREFLDIFNSRCIGLFFQAWKRYRWPLLYQEGMADPMTRRAMCLIGLGTEHRPTNGDLLHDTFDPNESILVEHQALDIFPNRLRLLAYAGLLSQRTRPPCNLEALLAGYFRDNLGENAPIEVEENVFQWAYLSPVDLNSLGKANSRTGSSHAFVAGTRVPDRMGAYRIHIGPLSFERFMSLLPDQKAFGMLNELARLASPFGMDFDVDLKLRREEVPEWKLGGSDGTPGRLGWTTWAQSVDRTEPGIVRLKSRQA